MRVVLDTNVLISALIRRDSIPGEILRAWTRGRFEILTHEMQLDEFRIVTRRPHLRALLRSADAGRVVNQLRLRAEMVGQLPHAQRSPDALDDFLLSICPAGDADYLVTGDKGGLLALKTHGRTAIVTARVFVELHS